MRVFQVYSFMLRSKIPFTDWPGIAQAFFRDQNLCYKRFQYYFDAALHNGILNPCERAAAEHPALGPVFRRKNARTGSVHCSLTNMDGPSNFTENDIVKILPSIYRRYGFHESYLIYQDLNFFGEVIPAFKSDSPTGATWFHGSSLSLYRDRVFPRWSSMDLKIEIVRNDCVLDATPYRDALAKLLPGVKCMPFTSVHFTPEEEQFYTQKNESITPLLEQAQLFFIEKLQSLSCPRGERKQFPLAGTLKKLCKKYGFSHMKHEYNMYTLEKRDARGHYISMEVDIGQNRDECNVMVDYKGAGFKLPLLSYSWIPCDSAKTSSNFEKLFQTILDGESAVLPPISAHYPKTPSWYSPS